MARAMDILCFCPMTIFKFVCRRTTKPDQKRQFRGAWQTGVSELQHLVRPVSGVGVQLGQRGLGMRSLRQGLQTIFGREEMEAMPA